MSVMRIADVAFGAELPAFEPDTSLAATSAFAEAVGWVRVGGGGGGRFSDHEAARKEGLPGALVPGIMAMGFLTSMIHRWSPVAEVEQVDTVFRAPVLADEPCFIGAVVTDVDEEAGLVQLDLSVKNAKDETRVFGTANVRLPK